MQPPKALFRALNRAHIFLYRASKGRILGSIVGSTDAAAVFAVLRSGGIRLPERLSATLDQAVAGLGSELSGDRRVQSLDPSEPLSGD